MINQQASPDAHRIRYHIEKMNVDAPNATNHKDINANLQAEFDRALDAFLHSLKDKIKPDLNRSDVIIIPEISIYTQARDAKGIARDMVATFESELWKRVDKAALVSPRNELTFTPVDPYLRSLVAAARRRETEENMARLEPVMKKKPDGTAETEGPQPLASVGQLLADARAKGVRVPATDAGGSASGLTPIADVRGADAGTVLNGEDRVRFTALAEKEFVAGAGPEGEGLLLAMGGGRTEPKAKIPLFDSDRVPAPASRKYTSEEMALDPYVISEMERIWKRSLELGVELGAWIYEKPDGTLGVYEFPLTDKMTKDGIHPPFPTPPDGWVGWFHTHTDPKIPSGYSDHDRVLGRAFGVPGVIRTHPNLLNWDEVKRDPGIYYPVPY